MNIIDREIIDIKYKLKKATACLFDSHIPFTEREAVILLKVLNIYKLRNSILMPNVELEGIITKCHFETIDGRKIRVIDEFIPQSVAFKHKTREEMEKD